MATICRNCGAEVPDTMRFCASCGTQIEFGTDNARNGSDDDIVPGKGRKPALNFNFNFKKLIIPAIVLVVVIVAVIIAVNIFMPGKYMQTKGSVLLEDGDETVIIIPSGKNKIEEIEGDLENGAFSMDGTAAAALIDEYDVEGFALYLVSDKPKLIADEVESYWFAASGDVIAYTKEYDSREGTAELWLYSGGQSKLLTSEFSYYNNCAISPDGKTLAFTTYDGERYRGALWDGKATTDLGRDVLPLAVSNGAKYIYYTRNDSFYVQKGTNDENREKLGENIRSIRANKDLTQIVFNYDSKGYISRNGGKRESLSGSIYSFILPRGAASHYSSGVTIYGISNFADTFYRNADDGIVHINSKYETSRVVSNVDYLVFLADDGKTLTYLKNDRISRVDGKKASAESIQIARDVETYVATSDGNAVFFIDEDDEIKYIKGTGNSVTVSNDYSNEGFTLFKGTTLFYISESELYSSAGAKGTRVSGIAGDVEYVQADMFSILVVTDDGGDTLVYRSMDGKKFDLIYEEY